ncbi:hypothetical protein BUALT_Bualt10G0065400 [Buddleja alternifolia]|uniref:Uncharacterized protein n=1 Tax=Buddleja alternifolia TaxID=168488 RepID=A0AAV6X357_9LAMI|nr:hypothetical protein BUALT_Bualt10G0065400 [Buddleja alternifolia]
MESELVRMCIEAATESAAAVEKWRRQRRTLERMPSHLAEALLRHLLRRRLLFPSLLEVFKYSVEEIDLRGESCVDAEWMAYLGAFRYLRSMILADCHRLNNSALWSITGMTNLKEVDLNRCSKITDAGIRHLLSVPALERLCISQTSVTAHGVAVLASLTNLLMLDLGGLPVTDSALNSLQVESCVYMLSLSLSLCRCHVSFEQSGAVNLVLFLQLSLSFYGLISLPGTNYFSLSMVSFISNCFCFFSLNLAWTNVILSGATIANVSEAFQYVETSRIHFMDLSNSSLQSFSLLRSMNALNHLNLSDTLLDDNSVEHITYIGANLRYLNLSNTKISSEGVRALAGHVSNLETILLSGTPIDDKAVSYISMMPALKVINLSNTNVKGLMHQADNAPDEVSSFAALQNLSHLERLQLEDIHIKETALCPLTNLGTLTYLSLKSVSLTDASLYNVSSAPKLIYLGVRDAVLTYAGLNTFVPPPTLGVLDLQGCWLLTKDDIARFCHKHPQIEVRHELVVPLDKRNIHFSSPARLNMKHKQAKLSMSPAKSDELFVDNQSLDDTRNYSRDIMKNQHNQAGSRSLHESITLHVIKKTPDIHT